MCGIAGAISWDREVDVAGVSVMTERIAHRGPDGKGLFVDRKRTVALGHRRLAIIDPAETGRQPFVDPDGGAAIVFNGEIYNYLELRNELEEAGVKFIGNSDTEVLLRALMLWGRPAISRLRGMFAFVFWDEQKRCLLLARDRLGIKPLYVGHSPFGLSFCSELDPLREFLQIGELNQIALKEFLMKRYISGRDTIWQGVHRVMPGEVWTIESTGHVSRESYWDLIEVAKTAEIVEDDICSEMRKRVEEAVHIHMRSDVPVGVFLSGGLDSTIISGIAQKSGQRRIERAFALGFGGDRSEVEIARQTAARLDIRFEEIQLGRKSLEEGIGILGRLFGEPLADSSAIPAYHLCQAASKKIKVVLGGDGGDELFCGYKWYSGLSLLDLMPKLAIGEKISGGSERGTSVLARLLHALVYDGADRFEVWHGASFTKRELRKLLVSPNVEDSGNKPDVRSLDLIKRWRVYDLLTYTVGSILYKVDTVSMACGLEVRVPFLDHRLVEWSLSLPKRKLYRRGIGKVALRECFPDILHTNVLSASKMGFSLPLKAWRDCVEQLAWERLIYGGRLDRLNVFREGAVSEILGNRKLYNRLQKLWTLLVLDEWLRIRGM